MLLKIVEHIIHRKKKTPNKTPKKAQSSTSTGISHLRKDSGVSNEPFESAKLSSNDRCMFCTSCHSKYAKKDMRPRSVTAATLEDIRLIKCNSDDSSITSIINNTGTFIHEKCRMNVINLSRPFKLCLVCNKSVHKCPSANASPETINTDNSIIEKIILLRAQTNNTILEKEYKLSIHKYNVFQFINNLPLKNIFYVF